MRIGYVMSHVSGITHDDQHFLVLRFDAKAGFKPGEGESWVVRFKSGTGSLLYGGLSWFTGLWRSPAGHVYVSSADSEVLVNPDPGLRAAPWQTHSLRGTLRGVWGVDDKCVFAWGIKGKGTVAYRFDGSSWSEIESPGEVTSMHGLSPKLVYAVGRRGLISRWDGQRWNKVQSPTQATLSDVFLADEDEMYAVGDRIALQGSLHGWAHLADADTHLFGVAKWKGKVWVGAANDGLRKIERDKLVSVDPELQAERLDARGELLVASPEALAFTTDGKTFKKIRASNLDRLFQNEKPLWVK